VGAPFYKKEGDETHRYIHLPPDFFLIAPEARERLMQFKYLPETKEAFAAIHSHWKAIEENAEYQAYLADFKTVNASLRDAKRMNVQEEINRLKEQRDKIKQCYKDWYTDVVLSLLQNRLKENDARLPSGWQKKEVGRIRNHKQLFFSKEIKGVTVLFTLKQLKNHDFYNGSGKKGALIDLMIARLQQEHPEKESYTY
jgi:hypothetical protein